MKSAEKLDALKGLESEIEEAISLSSYNDETVKLQRLLSRTKSERFALELEEVLKA